MGWLKNHHSWVTSDDVYTFSTMDPYKTMYSSVCEGGFWFLPSLSLLCIGAWSFIWLRVSLCRCKRAGPSARILTELQPPCTTSGNAAPRVANPKRICTPPPPALPAKGRATHGPGRLRATKPPVGRRPPISHLRGITPPAPFGRGMGGGLEPKRFCVPKIPPSVWGPFHEFGFSRGIFSDVGAWVGRLRLATAPNPPPPSS